MCFSLLFAFKALLGGRSAAASLLAIAMLSGCGGGSGDASTSSTTNSSAADASKVVTSVDSSLQGPGALTLARSLSEVETQPSGVPVSAPAGAVVYGLDTGGNIALAGNVVDRKVVYSAEGTVLAMGATVLQGIVPTAAQEQLRARIMAADGYAALVAAVKSAVLAGKNPLEQSAVQQGFDTVLTSAARSAVQAQSVQSGTARALAVAPSHAPDVMEPTVLETALFKVAIVNRTTGEPTFASKVHFQNTSAVFFKVALKDPAGAPIGSAAIDGAGASLFSLAGVLPIKVDKTRPGPFSVQLTVDDDKNGAEMLKAVMSLIKPVSSECVNAVYQIANTKAIEASITKAPLDQWTNYAIAQAVWKTVNACAAPDLTSEAVSTVFKGYSLITKLVGIGRLITDRALVLEPVPETGVCLTEGQFLMSCVAAITADAIKPMMPGAVQPINVVILDERGRKTLPYGLRIEYSNPNLFELSSTMTQLIANTAEGTGTLTITDPATDKTFSMTVKVTNGKLDKVEYTVLVNGSVEVKLIDPASGEEVFRNPATFRLPDSK